jgi:glutamate dehydrogenase (NADP+)
MYGQYKRINSHHGQIGKGLLWGGTPVHIQAQGFSTVYFAKRMLADKGQSLEGKMCLITGSNATAVAVAEKLLELGAVPITFTDQSGFIYEPQG